MLRVKGQDGFCPLGPALVDAADVDPGGAGRAHLRQRRAWSRRAAPATDLLFPFDYQIADVSRLITLEPGDVLLTGTPANSRPVEPGDVVEVEVEGIGRLRNRIVELERELEPTSARRRRSAPRRCTSRSRCPRTRPSARSPRAKWA